MSGEAGARVLGYGLAQQRAGNLAAARVARAVLDSIDARRGAEYSRTWARVVAGRMAYIENAQARYRAERRVRESLP